uniref:Uncharacterized protein n=1 Tax=Trichuris muris TaxID=70415 RepID=A0A5S6QRB4_TRIMR
MECRGMFETYVGTTERRNKHSGRHLSLLLTTQQRNTLTIKADGSEFPRMQRNRCPPNPCKIKGSRRRSPDALLGYANKQGADCWAAGQRTVQETKKASEMPHWSKKKNLLRLMI